MKPVYIIAGSGIVFFLVLLTVFLLVRRKRKKTLSSSSVQDNSKLESERNKSDLILASIDDAVIVLDENKAISLFNPAAAKMTGWAKDEATGLDYRAVIKLLDDKNEPVPLANEPFLLTYQNETTTHNNAIFLQTKSGEVISLDITVSPFISHDLSVKGVVAVFRDVSQQKKEEAQRADFISTASHEMRTPVAAIEGYLALALNSKVCAIDEKARAFLLKAHESTEHLGNLFQDLLTSSKAEDGRLTNHPEIVELGGLVESLSNDLKFSADKKSLAVEFSLGGTGKGVEVHGAGVLKPLYYSVVDPERIREVVTNLFDNAVKYTDSGKVSLSITGNDDVVQIRIADTGHGIPAADIPHLFQKFYRVDNSATRTIGGTGLGLFICRKIVEMYGGKIWLESQLDKGTTFFIHLPRTSTLEAQNMLQQQSTTTHTTGVAVS